MNVEDMTPEGDSVNKSQKKYVRPVGAVLCASALLIIGVSIGGSASEPAASGPQAVVTVTPTPSPTYTYEPPEPTPSPTYTYEPPTYTPKKSDWSVKLQTVRKACFGSAGCNLTVKPKLVYSGSIPDVEGTMEVTFSISGDEYGPRIESIVASFPDGTFEMDTVLLSTPSAGTVPRARITSLEFTALDDDGSYL